jgi:long-chain acyl-CoA synthetase
MNIYDTIINSTNKYTDKFAAKGSGLAYTYKELLEYTKKTASLIKSIGLNPRAKAVIYLQDSIDYIAAIYSVNMAGLVFVPVSPQAKDLKLQEIIEHSGSEILITTKELLEHIVKIDSSQIPLMKSIILTDSTLEETEFECKQSVFRVAEHNDKNLELTLDKWSIDEPTAIFYMSDKFGRPKGIMLSTGNILSNAQAIIEYLKMSYEDNILIIKSMALVGTVTGEIIASIAVGAQIVILNGMIHAGIILKAIQDNEITGFFAVPVMLHQIIEYKRKDKYSTASLRYIQTGAAKLIKEDVRQLIEMYEGVEFFYIYGLSEASPRVLHLKPEEMLIKAGSVGKPVKYCKVVLLDANRNIVKPGEIGEIFVQGSNVMLGYYNSPELTKEVLTENGLKTGDLAFMDDEEYIYLAGRADNMINQGGFHIYPAEIENAILKFEKVKSVKVHGISDEILGEKIKAVITPKDNIIISESEVFDFCYSHMENAKIPKIIEIA